MFTNIGVPGLILIVVIALVIFGPSKLPEMGRALGMSLREFKRSSQGLLTENKVDERGETESVSEPPNRN